MLGAILFVLFIGAFIGLAIGLLFGLRAVKLI
ncbi:cytochrome b6-f complex subunit PetL [Calothrix sp. PCC 6303]|nr:cytochrome b6-f complex subunit PetL [Calothrix sp. PCC 6303]